MIKECCTKMKTFIAKQAKNILNNQIDIFLCSIWLIWFLLLHEYLSQSLCNFFPLCLLHLVFAKAQYTHTYIRKTLFNFWFAIFAIFSTLLNVATGPCVFFPSFFLHFRWISIFVQCFNSTWTHNHKKKMCKFM